MIDCYLFNLICKFSDFFWNIDFIEVRKITCYDIYMINFDERLIDIFSEISKENYVKTINIGLGYTAVELKNGNCGVCCTLLNSHDSCTVYKISEDFEDQCCFDVLLSLRKYNDLISRAIVIAMVNALSQAQIDCNFLEDKNTLFEDLDLDVGKKVAMIGYFKPIVNSFNKKGVEVVAYDIGKEVGDENSFYTFVNEEASALIITATSFINNTFSDIIDKIKSFKGPVSLLGPSTIMNEKLYDNTPITILGGTYVSDTKGVLKSIRMGKGTPSIHKNSIKVYSKIK